ncbi:DUF4179 domain-containing protein [Sinanaerobacter sp. ZZT-01]|uniref:DUF4179 domain-containing protein n=1 Tax=Sinanaerobacter sp. ZZT-01 TaxID=3111540 RepID=UPI002D769A29|nr:DUF4179 domain-containing protein [Sinanaerobacter sp. ZZT-01]WRR93679.1 DUF4179 domain-containing protein [Sinanaerobacter sp. ZZT-01]
MNKKNTPQDFSKFLSALDQCDLRETEMLLTGIRKVTLSSDEQGDLKAKILRRAGIEDLSIQQDQEKEIEGKRRIHNKRRIYMRRMAACAAVIMVCSTIAIAGAHLDGLQRYWGNDTNIYGDRTLETVQSVQNDDIKVNIEGVLADQYQCVFVLSAEALTKEGQKMINKGSGKHMTLELEINPTPIDPSIKIGHGVFQYTNDNKNKDYKAYQCDFELKDVDITKPVTVNFHGLTVNFDIPEQIQTVTLYPDSVSDIESIEVSPIGYYYKGSEHAEEINLINRDNSLADDMGYSGAIDMSYGSGTMIIGSFSKLVDLNDYKALRIDGVDYIVPEEN